MISRIVSFSLKNPLLILVFTLILAIAGGISFKNLPIEAYPDIADPWVQVITQWPGHAAEEIESQLTIPLEIAFNGVPHRTALRSVSLAGLSVVTLVFDENTEPFMARLYVMEKLSKASLPNGLQPSLAPMSSPTGELYWYILDSKNRSPMELKELEDWELEKRWKEIPGVADVSSFGGMVKQYQVLLNPASLANYNLSTANVVQALSNNNQNFGGGFVIRGEQALNIRGVGTANQLKDIENVIVSQKSGTPIRVKNVGQVVIGNQPRLGKVSMSEHLPDGSIDDREDIVWGKILSRTGEVDEIVLNRIHEKAKEIQKTFLPRDIKIKPYIDRLKLIRLTTHTVEENMATGMILVLVVLLFFLGNLRSAMIVAATIPLSLLFTSILLDLRKIPANLLSLGALDFGMIVDGAVVMVENIFRHKQEREAKGEPDGNWVELIITAAREVERPIVYAIAIIILAYLPIFTLQRIEGKLFTPMAWTVAFALLGSMVLVLTVVPVLCSFFLKGKQKEWHNPYFEKVSLSYKKLLGRSLSNGKWIVGLTLGALAFVMILSTFFIGSEFLPHLDEGNMWVRGAMPPSTSYETASEVARKARAIFMSFEEVTITVCQVGRPDDGTDATGFFNSECFVDLKPTGEWRSQFHHDKEHLISAISRELAKVPGVTWNFSQPISDNMEEAVSGVKGELVVKVTGQDLKTLTQKADEIKEILSKVKGIEDLGVFQVLGQPNINISVDRDKISRYGLNVSDVQDVLETAVGGKVASQVLDGEKRFDLVVRYQPQYRESVEAIKKIAVVTSDGFRIPLEELADIRIDNGASLIYRQNNSRFIAVKFSVRGRDLGSTIDEAQALVKQKVLFPEGYHVAWSGEFESQRRAAARLALVIPLTILAIFLVLYLVFHSMKWSLIIMVNVALALIGGVPALFLTGTNFSVSSGIGFLALFGVSIQTGVLLISYINHLRMEGMEIREAIVEGACRRLRPIMMTALAATFGLIPAALSHSIGSDSQRPMAIVIVGGLVADLILAFFLLPTLYLHYAKPGDLKEETHKQ